MVMGNLAVVTRVVFGGCILFFYKDGDSLGIWTLTNAVPVP